MAHVFPRAVTALLLSTLFLPAPGMGQVIPVKSVPVAAGDQFLLFPSSRLGMGQISLSLPDTLGDPFSNPATGTRLQESVFFASPTVYRISEGNGSARAFPLGALFRAGAWFGGAALSIQEVKGARRDPWIGVDWAWWDEPSHLLSEGSTRNLYAFGALAYEMADRGLSLGISGFWADLGAMDGVDLLYADSREIRQSGTLSDLRVGVLKEWAGGHTLEAVLLRSRLRMAHNVTFAEWVWPEVDPEDPVPEPWPQWITREERNLDHTDTWGAHLGYRRPLSAGGWTLAWALTGNWKDHPKIPNYQIQNIPRDPGTTRAFGASLGVGRVQGPMEAGVEVGLEPILSDTWADAATDTLTATGEVIPAGAKTVENDFTFLNLLVRGGISWRHRWVTLRGGIQLRSISYELEQFNRVLAQRRNQEESWMEWTPSLGASVVVGGAVLRYVARITTGTGRPSTRWREDVIMEPQGFSDIILAPNAPLTLQDARVTTHQLSVVIPLR